MNTTPKAFVPNEDMGSITTDVKLPEGAYVERTEAVLQQIQDKIKDMPEIETNLRISGRSMISASASNFGMIIIRLKPWAERPGKESSAQMLIKQLFARTADIKDAKVVFFAPPTIQGFGMSGGFELQLQDQLGAGLDRLNAVKNDFLAK